MPYDTLSFTLHVYKPTEHPVASRSMFLDVQVLTLLLGQITLLVHVRYTALQTGHGCIFHQQRNTCMSVCAHNGMQEKLNQMGLFTYGSGMVWLG